MAKIGTLACATAADSIAKFKSMSNTELVAQELVQKGAIHALEFVVSGQADALEALTGLQSIALHLRAELVARGLPVIDELDIVPR